MNKQISENVIQRLPKYYRYLQELTKNNVTKVSSKTISTALHLTASQVRQDLYQFGGFGQQGYGYDTESLKSAIKEILGLDEVHTAIIIGGGRIGQALANYKGFKNEKVNVLAIFDIETSQLQEIDGIEVYNVSELEKYLKNNKIDIAIISVQKENAENVAKMAVNMGVNAIWNFAPIDLYFGDNVVCENINMSESLMRLIYKSKKLNKS